MDSIINVESGVVVFLLAWIWYAIWHHKRENRASISAVKKECRDDGATMWNKIDTIRNDLGEHRIYVADKYMSRDEANERIEKAIAPLQKDITDVKSGINRLIDMHLKKDTS